MSSRDKNVFYSWQSDLPNPTNRSFILTCIETAVKAVGKENLHLQPLIDRDTSGKPGSPDIASTIFKKIDESNIFIADVSFINKGKKGRKTPNPNVMIEVGYAAKVIGWDNIILVFNQNSGNLADLPFDIKLRRIMTYRLGEEDVDKSAQKKALAGTLKTALDSIINAVTIRDFIQDFAKEQLDRYILQVYNHVFKIVDDFTKPFTDQLNYSLLDLSHHQFEGAIFEKKFPGFTILKEWGAYAAILRPIVNSSLSTFPQSLSYQAIKIIQSLEDMQTMSSHKGLFIEWDHEFECRVEQDHRPTLLMIGTALTIIVEDAAGEKTPIDYGQYRTSVRRDLKKYFLINRSKFEHYDLTLWELLQSLKVYIEAQGLLVDPMTYRF